MSVYDTVVLQCICVFIVDRTAAGVTKFDPGRKYEEPIIVHSVHIMSDPIIVHSVHIMSDGSFHRTQVKC